MELSVETHEESHAEKFSGHMIQLFIGYRTPEFPNARPVLENVHEKTKTAGYVPDAPKRRKTKNKNEKPEETRNAVLVRRYDARTKE
jgi:hypothetical protein